MANNIFYQYLEAAFRYRVYNPKGKTATPDTHFSSFGYNLTYKKVFEYARKILPAFYRNPAEFPDTEAGNLQLAKKVLEKLDKHQDIELENQFKGITVSEAQNQAIAEAQTESQQSAEQAVPASTATNTPVGGMPFGAPSAPSSISSAPHRVFQTPPPVSGMEGGRGQGTAATAKANRLATQPASVRTEAPAASSGNPSKTAGSYTPGPQGFNFSAFKSSASSSFKKAQNFASPAGPFLKVNLGRLGRGMTGGIRAGLESANPFLGRMGTGLANNLSRIPQPGIGRMGGSRSFFGRLGGLGRGGGKNILARGNGKSVVSSGAKKWALGLVGFLLIFGLAFFGGINETTSTGETAPLPVAGGDISSCKFTRSGNSLPVKSSILQNWIVNAAATAGIPPQILASIAMHENQNFTANNDDNHDAIKTNQFCNKGEQICVAKNNKDLLHPEEGKDSPCTPDEVINQGAKTAQAVGLMQNLDIYNPGKDLCSITENLNIAAAKLKASGITAQPTEEQVNKAISDYYGKCTYGSFSYCNEVWQDLQSCRPTTPIVPITTAIASCPIPGGSVSTPSYQAGRVSGKNNGHCDGGYAYTCNCETSGRRAKAIDVPTNGQAVKLPQINNQDVKWRMIIDPYTVDSGEGGGVGYTFQATQGADSYYLDMLHLNQSTLSKGVDYPSGTAVATSVIAHVHMTMGKNLKESPVAGTATDCDSGWLPSDFMCSQTTAPLPLIAESFSIGRSFKGLDITAYKLGNGPLSIAIAGGLNGLPEKAGIDMVNQALAAYSSKGSLPSNITLYFVPLLNPDSSQGSADWNGNNVDLNRNFDSSSVSGGGWNKLGCSLGRYKTAGGEERWCGDNKNTSTIFNQYCNNITDNSHFFCTERTGNTAFSEPETKAIRDFITSRNIKAVISYRAPFNNVTNSNAPIDKKLTKTHELSTLMASWLQIPYEPYFRAYPITGQFMDWLQDRNIIGVEVEINGDVTQKYHDGLGKAVNWLSQNL